MTRNEIKKSIKSMKERYYFSDEELDTFNSILTMIEIPISRQKAYTQGWNDGRRNLVNEINDLV